MLLVSRFFIADSRHRHLATFFLIDFTTPPLFVLSAFLSATEGQRAYGGAAPVAARRMPIRTDAHARAPAQRRGAGAVAAAVRSSAILPRAAEALDVCDTAFAMRAVLIFLLLYALPRIC